MQWVTVYRTVPFIIFFPKSASSTVRSGKYYRFFGQKRETYRCNLNTFFRLFFLTANRTVAKTRPFYGKKARTVP
jgi:hypothetical protein